MTKRDSQAACAVDLRMQFGFNFGVVWPGQPVALYHREDHQEGFLVLSGECLLLVEGEERVLKQWDYFHCPAGVAHIVVGAGDGPAFVVAVSSMWVMSDALL